MPTSSSEKKPKLTAATCAVVTSLLGIAAMVGSPPSPSPRLRTVCAGLCNLCMLLAREH